VLSGTVLYVKGEDLYIVSVRSLMIACHRPSYCNTTMSFLSTPYIVYDLYIHIYQLEIENS